LKKKYNTLDHALDVQSFLDCLAVEQYKIIGVSGGGPYAVAFAHIASRSQVLGTLLMAPATPVEASRLGQTISTFFFEMLVLLLPQIAEARTRWKSRTLLKLVAPFRHVPVSELRKLASGREFLVKREKTSCISGHTYDYAASERYWGFELEDVDANRILIYAGGQDKNTPLAGARYLRNRLENSELKIYPNENHHTLQHKYWAEAREILRNM
jgi:pimeloyl-ACP methyl ester carboxylesterase